MSKKKGKKRVLSRRFKRTVRYTVAAMCMVTAITVAAIPAQENRADNEVADKKTEDNRDTKSNFYDVVDDRGGSGGDKYHDSGSTPGKYYTQVFPDDAPDLSFYHRKKVDNNLNPGDYEVALGVTFVESENTYILDWKYHYYGAQNAGVMGAYNDLFTVENQTLDMQLAKKYKQVELSDYDEYFKENGEGDKTYTFTYQNYLDNKHINPTGDFKVFEKYDSGFENFIKECDAYKASPNPDPDKKPTDRTLNPIDLPQNQKLRFYCDYELGYWDIQGTFSMVPVSDRYGNGLSSWTPKTVYLIKVTDLVENTTFTTDSQGFIIEDVSDQLITAIGDYAFSGTTGIKELKVPESIVYVGDNAFENSFITHIDLGNTSYVGNAAFKNSPLKSVILGRLSVLGAEAFLNCQELVDVNFSSFITNIGAGAFSGCRKIQTLDFTQIQRNFTIGNGAFYDCQSLTQLILPDGVTNTYLKEIGVGAFAVASGSTQDQPLEVTLPSDLTTLPDYLFAGRSNLKTVTFPGSYGSGSTVQVPQHMFAGCTNLDHITFPDTCVNVEYENEIFEFYDVCNPNFYVWGPAQMLNRPGADPAKPRRETWTQKTMVNDFVPYQFLLDGVEYYETGDAEHKYVLTVNTKGELTSCILINKDDKSDINLVIPKMVGKQKVDSVVSGCFDTIKPYIVTITVEDESISTIDTKTFEGCPKLTEVEIGNSVSSIGANAFATCPKLIDVTFHTPSGGYEGFTIGEGAFTTTSQQLTFHGDIVSGYAPFDWATSPTNYMNEQTGVRVCYESLSPSYLKVIYDGNQNAVTLIDYPKYIDIDNDHKEDNKKREEYYYGVYSDAKYDQVREQFKNQWFELVKKCNRAPSLDERKAFYKQSEEDGYYGPWITPKFVEKDEVATIADGTGGTSVWEIDLGSGTTLTCKPDAYFDMNPYSILNNYENPDELKDWKRDLNPEEQGWIDACLNINVPEPVKSIDVKKFLDDEKHVNNSNKTLYLDINSDDYKMYNGSSSGQSVTPNGSGSDEIVGGLFSGYFNDSTDAHKCPAETIVKGNDYVETITLNGVTSLPSYVFDSCENLKAVTLGPDCKEIGTAPFRGCTSLNSVAGNDVFFGENGLFYERIGENNLKIKECLASRGLPNGVGAQVIDSKEDPNLAYVTEIAPGAFQDCEEITGVDLSDAASAVTGVLKEIPDDAFRSCGRLSEVILPETVDSIQEHAFAEVKPLTVKIPGREVFIATTAFDHESNVKLRSYPGSAAEEYANYYKPMRYENIDDTYRVVFLDHDGKQIGETQYVEEGKNATPPADPTWEGHTFNGWSGEYIGITKDTILVAQYYTNGSSDDPNNPGGNGGNGNDPSNPNGGNNGDNNGGNNGDQSGKYVLTVINGSGSGSYAPGTSVIISANNPPTGKMFYNWTLSPATMGIISSRSAATTITMPESNATVTANYIDSGSSYLTVTANEVQPIRTATGNVTQTGNPNKTNNNNNTNTNRGDNGGTKVSVTKPGISNRDLASATVNGSTDNFIVKISDSALATEEVQKALMAKYGSLDAIHYVAMDISLYDSTGTTKIENTAGLTVDITIPLPDALIPYAGNNKPAAVVNGQLEELTPKFSTIDGVACVTFRATHFSPYTIYSDANNLAGGLDDTPKTGDPIAPKWFFSIGLAALSVLLFMKKDKPARRVKSA